MSQFYVKVETDCNSFEIDTSGDYPRIKLQSKARRGRANKELVERLSDKIGEEVGIVSGYKKSRKKVTVGVPKEKALERLED
ncbi:MAG: DUF167 family protein [Candidatus Nanohaloarchaeota archaeon QJJ-9]|nr:DUF167 family protein [Candidatus Nanohaloarchaeota archaeon QJJ-9]